LWSSHLGNEGWFPAPHKTHLPWVLSEASKGVDTRSHLYDHHRTRCLTLSTTSGRHQTTLLRYAPMALQPSLRNGVVLGHFWASYNTFSDTVVKFLEKTNLGNTAVIVQPSFYYTFNWHKT